MDAVPSSAVTTKINAEKQGRHIKASPAYISGRSYINGTLEDAQRLVDELSGTGIPLKDASGNRLNKERVRAYSVLAFMLTLQPGRKRKRQKA